MSKKKYQRLNTNFINEAYEKLDNFIENTYGAVKNRNDVLEFLVLKYIDDIELIELLKYIWEKNNKNKTSSSSEEKNNNIENKVEIIKESTDNYKEKLKKQAKSLELK